MPGQARSAVRVADVIREIEQLAPLSLAEDWDNCGLQVGSRRWPVTRIWIALDPLPEVIQAAADQQVDLLITHHPLLFSPLRSVDVETPSGHVIETALASRIAVYSAHTNLDSTVGGINDMLAGIIGLTDLVPLVPARGCQAEIDGCAQAGMGRIGRLVQAKPLKAFVRQVKASLNLPAVKVVGQEDQMIRRVALCSGAGTSLLDEFFKCQADVYLTGDVRYHDARKVEDADRAILDVGHFASEHIFIERMVAYLKRVAEKAGWPVDIAGCRIERDPFMLV